MKQLLTQLEHRLENWWAKPLTLSQVLRELNYLIEDLNPRQSLPQAFSIRIHPADLDHLRQSFPYLERQLTAYSAEQLRYLGGGLALKPAIHLTPLELQARGTIQVSPIWEVDPQISTNRLEQAVKPDHSRHLPLEALLLRQGSIFAKLERVVLNIGRRADNHIIVDDPRISRHHCQLRARFGVFTVYDLQSRHGVFVNGVRITEYPLQNGDVVSLGGVQLIYLQAESGDSRPLDDTQPTPPLLLR